MRLTLRGSILTPTEDGVCFLRDGSVTLHAGVIERVGRFNKRRQQGLVRDVRPGLIVPGFVDTHLHYPQTRIVGRATGPLLDWLAHSVFPEEGRFRAKGYASAVAEEFINRMLASGTTTAAVFSSSHERATAVLLDHLDASGMRALVGLTLMDRGCPATVRVKRVAAMTAARRLVRRYHERDGRLRFAVTPRFALSCSRALLRDGGRLSRDEGLAVQTHIGETPREASETLALHRYASDYLDVYDQAGLLHERTLLAHAIHLSKREWDRLAEAGASVAHCPDSNFFLGSGRMDVRQAERRGVCVGLGSDVAAGRSFSLRRAMASAYDNATCLGNGVGLESLFEMATLGGARALGWDDRIGSLECGKDADLVVIELPHAAKTQADALAELVFDNDQTMVKQVYVRGRRLLG